MLCQQSKSSSESFESFTRKNHPTFTEKHLITFPPRSFTFISKRTYSHSAKTCKTQDNICTCTYFCSHSFIQLPNFSGGTMSIVLNHFWKLIHSRTRVPAPPTIVMSHFYHFLMFLLTFYSSPM